MPFGEKAAGLAAFFRCAGISRVINQIYNPIFFLHIRQELPVVLRCLQQLRKAMEIRFGCGRETRGLTGKPEVMSMEDVL